MLLVFPKIFEPIGRHLGVSNRVHDIIVAHVVLKSSRIDPVVCQFVASGVPKHVRMNWEWELGGFSGPGNHFQEPCGRGGPAALGDEDISRLHIFPAELTQRSDFPPAQGMDVIDPALGPADM